MLRNAGILTEDPEGALDLYFKQCSVVVDGHDLAPIAATLANGGVNPASGAHAVAAEHVGAMLASCSTELDPHSARPVSFQPQLDLGLEWCERGLLERHGAACASTGLSLAKHRLCAGATAADLRQLERRVEHRQFEAGSTIVRRGDAADALCFLPNGEVSVIVELPQGGFKRLSTLSPGMGFGEAALIAGGVRSADVRAGTAVGCCTLNAAAFAEIEPAHPSPMIRLMRNLMHRMTETTVRLTAEAAALEG